MKKEIDKTKTSYRINISIFIIGIISIIWMMSGLFATKNQVLSGSRLSVFKFFTVDANAIMAIIALITAINQKKL